MSKLGATNRAVISRVLWLVLLAVGISSLIWAQAETGQITGTVTDPSGASVPNADVTVTKVGTGAVRTATSSAAGDFAVANLLPGNYEVSVKAPGFTSYQRTVTVAVGQKTGVDVKLQIGQSSTVVQVAETAVQVNTETQTLGTTVTTSQVTELPTLTRNPYDLVAISGNVSNAGMGDRGVNFAINGQREDSTNVLLDGAANNDEFNATIGQAVPLDSIQEFSILTNNFTAEFGRASGGIVNVVTKSGTNEFHGTAYEFNRVSALSSNSFQNNAYSLPKSVFTRNQFGYSLGGPVKKDKLFFFSSTEWIRIRSVAEDTALVPTNQFLSLTAPNTQSFFNTYGKLASGVTNLGTYSVNQFVGQGQNVCGANPACLALDPNMPLFSKVAYLVNGDAGGGLPDNEYQTVARMDYNLSETTQMYARYALQSQVLPDGIESSSPYSGFNTGQNSFNNNALFSVTHSFSPSFVSQSKAVFNRLNTVDPLGSEGIAPTLYTGPISAASLLGSNVTFPGYYPATPGQGGYFGGPQNFVQLYEDLSWSRGKHELRFGGSFDYERDNRTYGAYETGQDILSKNNDMGTVIGNLLSGNLYEFIAAINPQGHYPGDTIPYPVGPPNFSRSNRYREGAAYVQDSWKVVPRLTLNLGLRWEYFGVQHNKNAALDANFYTPANLGLSPAGITAGKSELASSSPIGALWKPDYDNFAPRLGFAWDITGHQTTVLRGGYGIGYERNFGNVTFNVAQNIPNYETATLTASTTNPILLNNSNYGPFSGTSGTFTLPPGQARYVDNNIKTAYAHFWSATIEHQISNSVVVGLDYSGSKGVDLYDLSNVNGYGYGNAYGGIPCGGLDGSCTDRLNDTYTTIYRRSNGGFSLYNAANFRVAIRNMANTGLTLTANYTWSHSIDNLSSTFSDASSLLTPNSGYDIVGLLDAFASNPDVIGKGNSDFDARQRLALSAIWDIPAYKHGNGLAHQVLGGWELAPIFTARTGSPYTIFDCTNGYNACPYAAFTGPVSVTGNSNGPNAGAPNTIAYLPLSNIDHFYNPLYLYSDLAPFPPDMTGRNAFEGPGFWQLDMGLYKNFSVGERVKLQLRGEAYNVFNHANLYVIGSAADVSATNVITACRGCTNTASDRRNLQLAAKIIF